MSIEVGAVYRVSFTVTDATGTLVDPATKTVTITLPDQSTVTPTAIRDSTGTFHADYTTTLEGLHKAVVVTTSPITCRTDYFNTAAWRSVVGISEAKLFINDDDADRDPILRSIMAAATEKVENIVGICVPRTFTDDRVPGRNQQVIRVAHGPILDEDSVDSVTSIYPDGPSWTGSDLIVYPEAGTVEASSLFWYGPWKVTYTAGRKIIPESVQLAVKEIIFDLWSIHRPYGANEMEPDPEETARFESMIGSYTIPPHARALLDPYEMPGFA